MISKIAEDIYSFNNQYFYSEPVFTYLLILEKYLIFFDIPKYTIELKNYLQTIQGSREPICFLSHGSCGIEDGTIWQKELNLKIYLHQKDKDHDWLKCNPDILFNESINIDSDIEIIHTPGHSEGSICLLHKPSKSLLTGDSIYSKNGKTLELDNNLNNRKDSLKKLLNYDFKNILPFHYKPIIGNAKEELIKFINL